VGVETSQLRRGDPLPFRSVRLGSSGNPRITCRIGDEASDASELNEAPHCRIDLPCGREWIADWCGAGGASEETAARELVQISLATLGIQAIAASTVERTWQVESAQGSGHLDAVDMARLILLPYTGDATQAIRHALAALAARGLDVAEQCQRVAALWGRSCRPISLIIHHSHNDWASAVHSIVSAVEISEPLRLHVHLTRDVWDGLQPQLTPHVLALLNAGLIQTKSPRRIRPPADSAPPAIDELKARAKLALARALTQPQGVSDADPSSPQNQARSLAELLLWMALEADPETTGLFALNARGGFTFGNREAEIDLLCQELMIAIEVDGYFHFQDKHAYRRDRAKDMLMQQAGMLVLRFLAEDVIEDVEQVVSRINVIVEAKTKLRK
jgi:very-short-patch-repair endonuclease